MLEFNQKKVLRALKGKMFTEQAIAVFLKRDSYRLKSHIVEECKRPERLFLYVNGRIRLQKKLHSFKRLMLHQVKEIADNSNNNEGLRKYASMVHAYYDPMSTVVGLEYQGLQAMIDKQEKKLLETLRSADEIRDFLKIAVAYSKRQYTIDDQKHLDEMILSILS